MVVWEQNDENMVHLGNSITIVQNTRHIILRLFLLQKLKSKWKATYKYTSYGIAMYRPSLVINHAIRVIASDLGYENFTGVPKIKTYPFANKDYGTYSLSPKLGHVCRDYCDRILTSMNIDIMHEHNPDTYFPKGFYNEYLSRIK